MTDRWLSVNEIASHLGVAAITIYRWLDRGQIPARKVGKQWRFSQTEIDAWVKATPSRHTDREESQC